MRSINHALTGSIIGFTINDPLIALPAAIASHFVLDMIPHHGMASESKPKLLRSGLFRYLLYIDAVLSVAWVTILAVDGPKHWLLAALCAFAAAAPDFLSFNRYLKALQHKPWKSGWYTTFAEKIQWFERPIGGVVEAAWFICATIMLLPFLV